MSQAPGTNVGVFGAVFVGGLVGTALRLALDLALPHEADSIGWSTIIVNVLGSFVLGLMVSWLWSRPALPEWVKAGLGAGVLGSFTTFSAISVSAAVAGLSGNIETAILDVAFSLILGLIAAATGIYLGSRLNRSASKTAGGDR